MISLWIPDIKTNDRSVRELWLRDGVYDTDWFPISNLVAYTIINGIGFSYVTLITKNRRSAFITAN